MAIKIVSDTYDNTSNILIKTTSVLNEVISEINQVNSKLDSNITPYVSADLKNIANNIDNINYNIYDISKKIAEKAEEFRQIEEKANTSLTNVDTSIETTISTGTSLSSAVGATMLSSNTTESVTIDNDDLQSATGSTVTTSISPTADLFTSARNNLESVIDENDKAVAATSATVATKSNSIFDWVADKVQKIGGFVWDAITHPIETLKRTAASLGNTVVALIQGLSEFVEALVDTAAIVATAISTPLLAIGDALQWIGGIITGDDSWQSATIAAWSDTKDFVSIKHVTNAFDSFHQNNIIGKWLDENSYSPFKSTGAFYKIADGVGYIGGIILLTLATMGIGGAVTSAGAAGGSAATATTVNLGNFATITITPQAMTSGMIATGAGFGKNTQNAWADGASILEGLEYGGAMGIWEGFEMFLGAEINTLKFVGLDGLKGQLLTTSSHVLLDSIDGGTGAFINPLMQMIYNPNEQNLEQIMYLVNYDENGNQISNKTWDDLSFFEKYKAMFDYNGGWGAVGTQVMSAGIMSFITEVPDIRKAILASKVVPSASLETSTMYAEYAAPDDLTKRIDDLVQKALKNPQGFKDNLNKLIMDKYDGGLSLDNITIRDYDMNRVLYGKDIAEQLEAYNTINSKILANQQLLTDELKKFEDNYRTQEAKINPEDPLATEKLKLLQDKKEAEQQLLKIAHDNGLTLDEYAKSLNKSKAIDPNLQAAIQNKAKEISTKAAQSEPAVTSMMKSLQDDETKLVGLEHRLKSQSHIEEKIKRLMFSYDINTIETQINDSLRYTLICDANSYSDTVISKLAQLKTQGYKIAKINNTWGSDCYKGLNITLTTPEGLDIELQFHTPASFDVKQNYNHTFYEISRSSNTTYEVSKLAKRIQEINQELYNTDNVNFTLNSISDLNKKVDRYIDKNILKIKNENNIVIIDVPEEHAFDKQISSYPSGYKRYKGTNLPEDAVIDSLSALTKYGNNTKEILSNIEAQYGKDSIQYVTATGTLAQSYLMKNPAPDLQDLYTIEGIRDTSDRVLKFFDSIGIKARDLTQEMINSPYPLNPSTAETICENIYRDSFKSWDNASKDAFDGMKIFTGGKFGPINQALRDGNESIIIDSLTKKEIIALYDHLDDLPGLSETTIMYRGLTNMDFIGGGVLKGKKGQELVDAINALGGGLYDMSDNAFESSTPILGRGFSTSRNIIEVTACPPGTKGAYIGNKSPHSTETEWLLNAGQGNKKVILGSELIDDKVYVYTQLIP